MELMRNVCGLSKGKVIVPQISNENESSAPQNGLDPEFQLPLFITGIEFGSFQVRSCTNAPNDVKVTKTIQEEEVKKVEIIKT